MAEPTSPMLYGRRLTAHLRRVREAASLSVDQVARYLACSGAKVNYLENVRVTVRIQDACDLMDLAASTTRTARTCSRWRPRPADSGPQPC